VPLIGRRTAALLLVAGLALSIPVRSQANLAITFDAQYSRILDEDKADTLLHWNGLGGTLFLEFLPVEFFSIGGALNFTTYFGAHEFTADPCFSAYTDGVVRILPLGLRGDVNPYLLGTFGWNPNSVIQLPGWTGTYHAQAGLGFFWLATPQNAMDFGLTYNLFSPETDLLRAASAHIGITFFTDPTPKAEAKKPVPIPRFDSLQAIAGREYGNTDLYPILIDANFKDLTKPLTWKAGTPLVIPRPLTELMVKDALRKSKDGLYLRAAETFHDPMQSDEYRKASRATGSYWVPITSKRRSFISFHAESLWDVASRPDVFGDPELYPLLVDANKMRLKRNYPFKPFNLVIPKPTKQQVNEARIKAWSVEYGLWRGKDITQKGYKDWQDKNGKWVEP